MGMICDRHLGGYFEEGDHRSWCPDLWDFLIAEQRIWTMLDIGCARGEAMLYFEQRGIVVVGVDGCEEAIRSHYVPERAICHDFTQGPWQPGRPFDLVWCSEFLEHVEERFLPNVLPALRGRVLALNAAVPGQGGWHHVNEQPPDYWIRAVSQLGFRHSADLTAHCRGLCDPHTYFARNGLIFTA